jgi:S-adenosylmethionine decarboxylase
LQQELIFDQDSDQVLEEDINSHATIHLPTGRHVIADLWECEFCHYTDDIEDVLRQAAQKASATVLNITIEKFPEIEVDGKMVQGMTGTVILSESHIAFHTWPESGFVAVDIFTCGTNALPEKGLEVILEHFKPKVSNVRILGRGQAAESNN